MPPSDSSSSLGPTASSTSSTASNEKMAPEDSRAPFTRIPWLARMVNRPDLVFRVPGSRIPKDSTEDSLYAEILKTPRTIRSCVAFYKKPEKDTDHAEEVQVAMTLGDGMNGHPAILHGGITSTFCDEAMGMYQSINMERAHMAQVKAGHAEGEISQEPSAFTAELKVTYLKPIRTPGAVLITVRRIKKEGRKEWLRAEVKQAHGTGEDDEGETVVCATSEALFIQPKGIAKL